MSPSCKIATLVLLRTWLSHTDRFFALIFLGEGGTLKPRATYFEYLWASPYAAETLSTVASRRNARGARCRRHRAVLWHR